jgi:hypothetical protein
MATSYTLPGGTVVKVGDRILVTTKGTITGIGQYWIEYKKGDSQPACVYPNDGEFVSLTVLPPEVKPGQVWQSGKIQLFVTQTGNGEPYFVFSSTGVDGVHFSQFFNVYPDATLVFDPDSQRGTSS